MTIPALSRVRVLANDGTGNFTAMDEVVSGQPGRFAVADLNADGNQDVVVALPAQDELELLFGSGAATFSSTALLTTDKNPTIILAAPLRAASTVIDIAVSAANAARISLFYGDGTGGFTPTTHVDIASHPEAMVVGDFAGVPSIVAVNRGKENISYLAGNGVGGFLYVKLDATKDPFDIAKGHFGAAGNLDVVTAELSKRVLGVYAGNGAGGFFRTQIGFPTQITFPTPVNYCGSTTNDDLLLVESFSDAVMLLCNVH